MLVCACPITPKSILIVPCLMVQSTMSKRTRNRGQTKLGTKPAALNGETQRLGKGNSKKKKKCLQISNIPSHRLEKTVGTCSGVLVTVSQERNTGLLRWSWTTSCLEPRSFRQRLGSLWKQYWRRNQQNWLDDVRIYLTIEIRCWNVQCSDEKKLDLFYCVYGASTILL